LANYTLESLWYAKQRKHSSDVAGPAGRSEDKMISKHAHGQAKEQAGCVAGSMAD